MSLSQKSSVTEWRRRFCFLSLATPRSSRDPSSPTGGWTQALWQWKLWVLTTRPQGIPKSGVLRKRLLRRDSTILSWIIIRSLPPGNRHWMGVWTRCPMMSSFTPAIQDANPHNISLEQLLFPKCEIEVQSIKVFRQSACDVTCGPGSKTRVFYSDLMFYMMDFTVSTMWECLLQRFPKAWLEIFTTISVETFFFF